MISDGTRPKCCENGQTVKVVTDYIIYSTSFSSIVGASVIQGGSSTESDIHSRVEEDVQCNGSLRRYAVNVPSKKLREGFGVFFNYIGSIELYVY